SSVSGNMADFRGGGIFQTGSLGSTLDAVTIAENTSREASAISVSGFIEILNSTIDKNENTFFTNRGVSVFSQAKVVGTTFSNNTGTGLEHESTLFAGEVSETNFSLLVDSSLFYRNVSTGVGGGINVRDSGSAGFAVINTTFSQNQAREGAAIEADGNVVGLINHATITDNISTDPQEVGLFSSVLPRDASVPITNSIVRGNLQGSSLVNRDGFAPDRPEFSNINGDPVERIFRDIDPDTGLILLTDNGGPVLTIALRDDYDQVRPGFFLPDPRQGVDFQGGSFPVFPYAIERELYFPDTDARGVERPQNGFSDPGAFERIPDISGTAPTITVDEVVRIEATGAMTPVTLPITANDAEDGDLTDEIEYALGYAAPATSYALGTVLGFVPFVVDSDGNRASAPFILEVFDTTPPTPNSMPPDQVAIANASTGVAAFTAPLADDIVWSDIFGIASRGISIEGPASITDGQLRAEPGVTEVTYRATDNNGNTGIYTQRFSVVNGEAPVLEAVRRSVPLVEETDADEVVFTALFDLPVEGADIADFVLTGTLAGASTILSVTGNGSTATTGDSFQILVDVPDGGGGSIGVDLAAAASIATPLAGLGVTSVSGLPRERYEIADGIEPAVLPDQTFSYDENQLADVVIGTVAVSDNLGVTSFEITGGDAAGFFAIDDGGALSLSATGIGAAANDFEALPNTFDLTITVRDAAGNSGSGTVTLNLRDLDEGLPVVAAGQTFSYDENQAAGFVIGTVAAADNVAIIDFDITGGDAPGLFTIDNAGALSLTAAGVAAAANDFETLPNEFLLTVTARDATGNEGAATVTVSVEDVDDTPPTITNGQTFSYEENQATGFVIGTVTATDNVAITGFDITDGDAPGFFAIDNAGGLSLTAAGAAAAANDFEALPNGFLLTVAARDAAGNESARTLTVSVDDIDDTPPVIAPDQAFSYAENQTVGAVIGTVAASDDLALTSLTITDGDPVGFFTIDNGGVLRLTAAGAASTANDFEALPNDRVLTITARDAAGNEDVETVSVALTDLDENAAPIAVDDLFQRSFLAPFSGNLLSDNGAGADRDPDGGALSVLTLAGAAPGAPVVLPSGASISGTGVGEFTYDPGDAFADLAPGETGTDSFAYVIVDDGNASASAVVDIRFTLPDPPSRKIWDESDNLWTLEDMLTACTVEGRGGIDTVVLPGALADFRIERLEGGFRFVEAGLDGAAAQDLLSVERIRFDDAELTLETDAALIETALLYDFLLDRFPERAGLSFWFDAAEAELSLAAIGERFVDSIEFQDRFAGPQENPVFLDGLYRKGFGRDADTPGREFWLELLDSNALTQGEVVAAFLRSEEAERLVETDYADGFLVLA
ncbi:MAG: DUF4214 domain-containing protein, partial [Pseudomonadota bacterium]